MFLTSELQRPAVRTGTLWLGALDPSNSVLCFTTEPPSPSSGSPAPSRTQAESPPPSPGTRTNCLTAELKVALFLTRISHWACIHTNIACYLSIYMFHVWVARPVPASTFPFSTETWAGPAKSATLCQTDQAQCLEGHSRLMLTPGEAPSPCQSATGRWPPDSSFGQQANAFLPGSSEGSSCHVSSLPSLKGISGCLSGSLG